MIANRIDPAALLLGAAVFLCLAGCAGLLLTLYL